MRRTRQRDLQVESLEGRALLSVVQAHAAPSPAIQVRQTGSMGNALPNSDVQALQQMASTNNSVMFLAQLALLEDRSVGVDAGATLILSDARDLDLQMNNLASSRGTVVPADITGADETGAKMAASSLNTGSFKQAYRTALLQAGSSLVQQLQQVSTGAQDADLQALGQTFLPIAKADLMNMVAILKGNPPSAPPSPPITNPTSTTLDSSDLQTLENSYSTTLTERFLAQFTALVTRNSGVEQYAEKLIQDHEQEAIQLGNYARATGTSLPASIRGQDVLTAQKVLRAAHTSWYDHVYLGTMVQSHTQDIQENKRTVATTDNPTLKEFAQDDIATDWLHRQGAASLMRRVRR